MRKVLTPEQHEELECLGLDTQPFSENACWRLYEFIKRGNNTYGADESSRCELAKNWISSWVGKSVRHRSGGMIGEVDYLLFRTRNEVSLIRSSDAAVREGSDTGSSSLGAFELMIRWRAATRRSANSPASVQVVETSE